MLRSFLAICILLACTGLAIAQQATSVTVRLTQPPPNQLRIADLWKVELINNSRTAVRVFLHGTAEELSIPDGIIADARTKVISLAPGRTMITGNDVQPVTVDEANKNYEEALLRTGSMPSGSYKICVEVVQEDDDRVLGVDCKFAVVEKQTIPMLINPPDESEVTERVPAFSWLPPSPFKSGQIVRYTLRIVEIFGKQTPYDAMRANPAWFESQDIPSTVYLYPISSRRFQVGQKYAWRITAVDKGARQFVIGESEIWSFLYGKPDDANGGDDTTKRNTTLGLNRQDGGINPLNTNIKADIPCAGDNWDFELGNLGCWTVEGEAFADDPVVDGHEVLGQLGQHAKYWVTSYGLTSGDGAVGSLLSEEFSIKNSTISFLAGGPQNADACVELLVERVPKDTFKFPTRKLAGMTSEFMIVYSTGGGKKGKIAQMEKADGRSEVGKATPLLSDVGGSSDKLIPVEWDVLKYLNRNARIFIRDTSKSAHVNADYFRFYDRELDDTIKLPVLVMAAGENHSLAATPEEKVKMSIRDLMAKDIGRVKTGELELQDFHVINETNTDFKLQTNGIAKQQQFASYVPKNSNVSTNGIGNGADDEPKSDFTYLDYKVDEKTAMIQAAMAIATMNPKNIVWGWGDNATRAIGSGFNWVVPTPQKLTKVKDVKALAAGMDHSFAVTKAGDIMAWGLNDYFQLGTNDRDQRADPTSLGVTGMVKVATGSRHALALDSKGNVWVWGYNRTTECGSILPAIWDATSGQITKVLHIQKPTKHSLLQGMRSIAAGHSHSVALSLTGNVYAWGANDFGQAGQDDDKFPAVYMPVQVMLGPRSERIRCNSIAAGDYHTLALTETGEVYAWGGNASGQLGNGTTTDKAVPVKVTGLPPKIKAIGAGATSSFAIDPQGNVWAWGNNALGQLGDGTRIGKTTPVKVSRIDGVIGVVGGGTHTMAVRADGSLWTWGTNEYGQLGEGAVFNLTPAPLDPPLGPIRVERLATE